MAAPLNDDALVVRTAIKGSSTCVGSLSSQEKESCQTSATKTQAE